MSRIKIAIILITTLAMLVSGVLINNITANEIEIIGEEASDDQEIAKLLKDYGYKDVTFKGKVSSYELSKGMLVKYPYDIIWGLQKDTADLYMGRLIDTYEYTVKNHKLDYVKNNIKNQTKLWILTSDKKIIGGYSSPDYSEVILGDSYFTIDGTSLEEVTGMKFQDWTEKWVEKYME